MKGSPKRLKFRMDPQAAENLANQGPNDDEMEALWNRLHDLTVNPNLGYPVAFTNPRFYRLDVGRFIVHYRFDENTLDVAYIGVY